MPIIIAKYLRLAYLYTKIIYRLSYKKYEAEYEVFFSVFK